MTFREKIKKDLQRGIKEGIHIVKEGVVVVKKKAEVLSDEGKKRYRIFELKTKVQREIAELGGKVYDLIPKAKNPLLDSSVKATISRIKKLEAQITKFEGKPKLTSKKRPAKRTLTAKRK